MKTWTVRVSMAAIGLVSWGCSAMNSEPSSETGVREDAATDGGEISWGSGDANYGSGAGGSSALYFYDIPPPTSTFEFETVGTNPFVIARHDPLSTFAADVDTASYELFRSQVQGGTLPDPGSVRLEEFVNYFAYDYEKPEASAVHPFSIQLAAAPNLVSRSTQLLRVGIQGKELPEDAEKKPTNLVFLVDTSGSMQEEIGLVQFVLRETLERLEPTDTISIVTYASSTGVALPATSASETSAIKAAISGLTSGGSTNGAGGIDAAYAQAQAAFIEGGINHVLICTDGDFNVGPSTTEELEKLIVEKRKTGITLTALGFGGGNYNDAMMERTSNAGNGIYGYIGSSADAQSYVAERMLKTLIHIAKDMKIQVEFNPEHVYAYRLLGYENRAIADRDFRNDVVDAGEVGNGHRVTALYEIVLKEADMPVYPRAPEVADGESFSGEAEVAAEDLVLVKVRYKEPDASEEDPAAEVASSLSPSDLAESLELGDSDLRWAAAVASFAEILKQSPYADLAALGAIRSVLAAQADQDPERAEFLALFDAAVSLLEVE